MRRRQHILQPPLLPTATFGALLLFFAFSHRPCRPPFCCAVHGKEVEATTEWQFLGENDTVAAGMHIRMDLTTGEKFVKLPDDDNDDDDEDDDTANKNNQQEQNVQVTASGGLLAMGNVDEEDAKKAGAKSESLQSGSNNDKEEPPPIEYDYDMMHRTLSQLPDDEKIDMGLPELPGGTVSTLPPKERDQFEHRMAQIWESRQAQLTADWSKVADLPKILIDRIQSIQDYLEHPGASHVHSIIETLQDLEYHLQDMDMTRDFHTLGGWTLLASLLKDEVHVFAGVATGEAMMNATQILDLSIDHIVTIQTHAAWAMGTAVKNTHEFAPYVLEVVDDDNNDGAAATTVLDLVVAQFEEATRLLRLPYTSEMEAKLLKVLYCLGSFLRGNRPAQIHFATNHGPALLAAGATKILDSNTKKVSEQTQSSQVFARKLLSKLLKLATDSVTDIVLHPDPHLPQVDTELVEAWTSSMWCQIVVEALSVHGLEETALETMRTLHMYCQKHWEQQPQQATSIEMAIQRIRSMWAETKDNDSDDDAEMVQDRLALVDDVGGRLAHQQHDAPPVANVA